MNFKVVTKDMLAPGKINFTFGEGQYVRAPKQQGGLQRFTTFGGEGNSQVMRRHQNMRKVELSVYFSANEKIKEPTKDHCDKFVDSPSGSITMPIQGKDRFDNEEVYLSLYSITGCVVNLTAIFPDLKIQNFSRQTKREEMLDESDFDNFLVCRKWRALENKRGDKKDRIISDNIDNAKNFVEYSGHRMAKQIEKRYIQHYH